MSTPLNISCVIAAHHEGIMLHWSLLSYEAMRVYAEERGARVEWVIVLDRADDETTHIAENHIFLRNTDKILYVDNGTLSKTRNDGISASCGDIIAVVDGDDYYSKNFLYNSAIDAYTYKDCIFHPHYVISFGSTIGVQELWDQRIHNEVNASSMVFRHIYNSAAVAHKSIFTKTPYLSFGKGFGFEDWNWNCEVMAKGYKHAIVRNTVLFYRRKINGMLSGMHNAIMPPTSLFNYGAPATTATEIKILEKYSLIQIWSKRSLTRWQRSIYKRLPTVIQKTVSRWKRSILKRLPAHPTTLRNEFFKAALLEISHIDPKLHPSRFPKVLPEYIPHLYNDRGNIFLKLCYQYSKVHYDVVYVVPFLIPGGADLMIINHANACARHGKNVLVISTLDCKTSTWRSRLDAAVEFLELGFIIASMPNDFQIEFLTKFLLQLAPDNTHFINSQLGHECLKKHADALKQYTSLISTFYCDDVRQDGTLEGYVVDYFTEEYKHVHKYTSDNAVLPKEWCRRYGTDFNRFHITYGFIEKHPSSRYFNESNNKVFWASRICDQKRPDILYYVASKMPHVEFHIYGEKYDDGFEDMVAKLKRLPNVVMKGIFSGFYTIPLEEYAAFLYTSKSDGLPNVILEAGESGMPIIGSVVGGIGDFLTDETGWPIPSNDPTDFIAALEEVLAHPELAAAKGSKARELVHKRHNEEAFWNNLAELYSFFSSIQGED